MNFFFQFGLTGLLKSLQNEMVRPIRGCKWSNPGPVVLRYKIQNISEYKSSFWFLLFLDRNINKLFF